MIPSHKADSRETDMNWMVIVFAISLLVAGDVIEAFYDDVITVSASQIHDQKDLDTSDDRAAGQRSTASDDVNNCTTTDDVTAARRSLCPDQCKCSPLDGQIAWTQLTVDCSGQLMRTKKLRSS